MSTIYTIADQHRRDLLQSERRAASAMVQAYGESYQRIKRELDQLTAKVQAARDQGREVKPSWLFQLGRLNALEKVTLREINTFARNADTVITGQQREAVQAAQAQAAQLVGIALEPAAQETKISAAFQRLPVAAVEELVGNLSDGSPLTDLLADLAPQGWESARDALVVGVALGKNPKAIAREVRTALAVPLDRALTIARTETLRAYRESTRRGLEANSSVIAGWTWQATLSPRTCPACWAMHGTFHKVDEKLDGHPNCRCAMVPETKSWAELGFSDIEETTPPPVRGEDELRAQPEKVQREVLGKGYDDWKAGKLKLADFVGRRDSQRWGTMRYSNSVVRAREQAARSIDNVREALRPTLSPTTVESVKEVTYHESINDLMLGFRGTGERKAKREREWYDEGVARLNRHIKIPDTWPKFRVNFQDKPGWGGLFSKAGVIMGKKLEPGELPQVSGVGLHFDAYQVTNKDLRFSPHQQKFHSVVAHEFGHYMDWVLADRVDPLPFLSEKLPKDEWYMSGGSSVMPAKRAKIARELMDAIDESSFGKQIAANVARKGADGFDRYMAVPTEKFARAFEVWLVRREGGTHNIYWNAHDDDFGPVAAALEKLLRSEGLLR